ncbi:sulfotransferase family protein [Tropicimonas marinistellae]|uniref:sulfotransferase family protein n=1 Tax=Tropicimonas marinistellae TaxID=1739787 RepID=UPI00082A84A2|nr:sulfotransferase [Tropicimonas marinistellae]
MQSLATTDRKPQFILGVGAQKAGTTWLFDYLQQHPQCAMGPMKEIHFFNNLLARKGQPGLMWFQFRRLKRALDKRGENLKWGRDPGNGAKLVALLEGLAMQYEPDRYEAYFERLVDSNPQARLIGDITPDYASLGKRSMAKVRDHLEKMGYPVKVVFLMRDPAERCYSSFRMAARNFVRDGRTKVPASQSEFVPFSCTTRAASRTRYEKTIAALEANFDKSQIYYGIYEDLFNNEEIARISEFLGVDYVEPKLDVRKNAGGEKKRPSDDEIRQVREHYRSTYKFCRNKFGAERIDRLWAPKFSD